MKASLVSYLRCPVDKGALQLVEPKWDSNKSQIIGGILSSAAGREYRIVEGVPEMVSPELSEPGQEATVKSFSEKWDLVPDYREDTKPHYQQWFLERYGFGSLDKLKSFLSSKTHVLDAGTGEGRDAEMYALNSKAEVFGIDLSDGVHVAYSGLGHIENLHLIKADLTNLPFEEGFFDFIACDQVIHHTKNTHASLKALLPHLGRGHIAIYTYKVKAPVREFCDDFIREQTVNMSPQDCYKFSEAMTKLGQSLSALDVEIEVPEDIPILELKAGKHNLQRWIYWNFFKCYWNDDASWESNVATNFDWYHPLYAHRHTPEEVRRWFEEEENIAIEHFSVVESGISVLANKISSN